MFCQISFMLRRCNKKTEFLVSTAVLVFQRLNKNHGGAEVVEEGFRWDILLSVPVENAFLLVPFPSSTFSLPFSDE